MTDGSGSTPTTRASSACTSRTSSPTATAERSIGTSETGDELEFAVASFATVRDGLLAELVEVWADVGQDAPAGTRPQLT